MPSFIAKIDKDTIVRVAREFISSNINALVAVSSIEKALINELASIIEFPEYQIEDHHE